MNVRFLDENLDCQNCKMAKQGIYKDSLKCCTFQPFLANYNVGGILLEDKIGAQKLREKIKNREFVLPLGALPNWSYRIEHKFKNALDFGNKESLLCPFFDSTEKNCQVWSFRASTCRAFYCESQYGPEGKTYWDLYYEAMNYLEMALSQDILLMMGFDWQDVEEQLSYYQKPENQLAPLTFLDSNKLKSLWQHYWGKEVDFFIKAYNYKQELKWTDYKKILGQEGLDRFDELNKKFVEIKGFPKNEVNL